MHSSCLSLVACVCVYVVAAIRLVVHSLAFECIGVALFVESGRFLLLYLSKCGPFLTVRCVGHAA